MNYHCRLYRSRIFIILYWSMQLPLLEGQKLR